MKKIVAVISLSFTLFFCLPAFSQEAKNKINTDIVGQYHKNRILVSAHRGDWRGAPENSLQSLKNAINMGVDIVEADIKMTKDGYLVIMHDHTIDRTTTGKGAVKDYTLKELKEFSLIAAIGSPTSHKIPTLDEFLDVAKNRVMVDLDKAFPYYKECIDLVNKKEMINQVIINVSNISKDDLYKMQLPYIDSVALNVIVSINNPNLKSMIESYAGRKRVIIHPTFPSDTLSFVNWMPAITDMSMGLWLNALWPWHNGGHDDDRAVERNEPDESWGWLIDKGASIIQTDRPEALLSYLRKRRLHD